MIRGLLCGLLLAGCAQDATQLVVLVDSNYAAEVEIAAVEVRVTNANIVGVSGDVARREVAARPEPHQVTVPFSVGLAPEGDGLGAAGVQVVAFDADGAPLVGGSVEAGFVRGETLLVQLFLDRTCASRWEECSDRGLACRDGACIDPPEPRPVRPGDELDASFPDGGAIDGGQDGGADGGQDGQDGGDPDAGSDTGPPDAPDAPDGAGPDTPLPRSCEGARPPIGCDVRCVPGGVFDLGEEGTENAEPVRRGVEVGEVCMDTHEVTVARFRHFAASAEFGNDFTVDYPNGARVTHGDVIEPHDDRVGCVWSRGGMPTDPDEPFGADPLPINCLRWDTAFSFCAWEGGRLPTEAEWQYVARGREVAALTSGRRYPWGDDEPTAATAETCGDGAYFGLVMGEGFPLPVGRCPAVEGFYDLAGNVGELTADVYALFDSSCWLAPARDPICTAGSDNGKHAIYGGGYWSDVTGIRSAAREQYAGPVNYLASIGFRCAYDR